MKRTNSIKQLCYVCRKMCRYATCIACINPFFMSFLRCIILLDWENFHQQSKNGRNMLLPSDISLKFGSIGMYENTFLAINDCANIHIDFFRYIIVTCNKIMFVPAALPSFSVLGITCFSKIH